jgi:hypothetical protein
LVIKNKYITLQQHGNMYIGESLLVVKYTSFFFDYVSCTVIFCLHAVVVSEHSVQNPPFVPPDHKRKNEQAE